MNVRLLQKYGFVTLSPSTCVILSLSKDNTLLRAGLSNG